MISVSWVGDAGRLIERDALVHRGDDGPVSRRRGIHVVRRGDAGGAAAILDGDDYAEMVRMEEAYWADNNVTGVPAFILGGRMLIPGAQDPEAFIRVIENKVLASAA